jgi:hypothetical protein
MDSPELMKQSEIHPFNVYTDHQPFPLLAAQFHPPTAPDDFAMVFKTTSRFVVAGHDQPVFPESFFIN